MLTNKAVLITGGKRIGAVVAEELARRGMDVALAYNRSVAEAQATVAAVAKLGRRGFAIQADLSQPGACAAFVNESAERLGGIYALVNMASIYRSQPFEEVDEARWNEGLDVDLGAAYFCSRAAVPYMRSGGGGRIVNFSDWIAASGRPRYRGYLPYYVAKRAVMGLTEGLALELAEFQILVNAIAPGPILAPENTDADEMKAVEAATPVGRWGGEIEIATAVLFLLDSGFVTGEVIRIDGGRHVR